MGRASQKMMYGIEGLAIVANVLGDPYTATADKKDQGNTYRKMNIPHLILPLY